MMPPTPLISDDLTCSHGFFTRQGGASRGMYESLNCGLGSQDDARLVEQNRAVVAARMGVKPSQMVGMFQTHSSRVQVVEAPIAPGAFPAADALVTCHENLLLAVLTADCMPVLFHDPQNRVVGAAHAGWRGALEGVLEATLEAMETLGARRQNITAVIGPCISVRAYEVGQEFYENFADDAPENTRFFANARRPDHYMFDLPGYGLSRLRRAEVKAAHWLGHCTYSDAARFFSFRRMCHEGGDDYGRMISVIKNA